MKILLLLMPLFFAGCPFVENPSKCPTVMTCEEEVEMFCDKPDGSTCEDCHYYVVEHCYEACQ